MQITNLDYQTLAPELYRFVRYRLSSAADAEDVVSQAFMKLLSESGEVVSPKAWLYTVARNMIYDKYRQTAKVGEINVVSELGEDQEESIIDIKQADIAQQAIDEIMLEQVKLNLQKLDATTQEVIVLRLWEEFSFAEIADMVHENQDTVKKRYYRGIEKLRALMEEKSTKVRSVALPIVIAGLAQLAQDPSYQMSASFKINLFNSIRSMSNMPTETLSGVQNVSLLAKLKNFLVSKWGIASLAVICVLIAAVAILISMSGTNPNSNNGNTQTTSSVSTSAVSSQSSSAAPILPRTQTRLLFDPSKPFVGNEPYPTVLTSLYDDQLQQMTCSESYRYDQFGAVSAGNDGEVKYTGVVKYLDQGGAELKDAETLAFLSGVTRTVSGQILPGIDQIMTCRTADKTIFVYTVYDGGGGTLNTSYVMVKGASNKTIIPPTGYAYVDCGNGLALTSDNMLYIRCGGGDGGGAVSMIYNVNLNNNGFELRLSCESTVNMDNTVTVNCKK